MRDIDDLLTQALQKSYPSEAFKERLKQQTSLTLVQVQTRGRRFHRCIITTAALLITFTAYLVELNTDRSVSESGKGQAQDDTTVQVPKDVLTWLEAGRFFNQLGLEQRAANAYRQASLLTSHMQEEIFFATEALSRSSYTILLSECDQAIEQQNKRKLITNSHHQYAILAQSIGGQNHEE